MTPKNRMREIRSYGSVGVPAGNCRHYPEAHQPPQATGTPAIRDTGNHRQTDKQGALHPDQIPATLTTGCRNTLQRI